MLNKLRIERQMQKITGLCSLPRAELEAKTKDYWIASSQKDAGVKSGFAKGAKT
ncbi:MAG: hypothetical protein FWF87_01525 [Synergistaceae bacterium]|nr:hypothetical protein [Synergistaceae bacterium]